jgi:hypothetical protein
MVLRTAVAGCQRSLNVKELVWVSRLIAVFIGIVATSIIIVGYLFKKRMDNDGLVFLGSAEPFLTYVHN